MTAHGRDKSETPGERSFAELIADQDGVVPIEKDPAVRRPAPRRSSEPATAPAKTREPMRPPDADEPLFAHRSFVRRKLLRELRAGAIRPDRSVDLHGHDRRRAKKLVFDGIREASRAGERCVLVIAGRGHRSAGRVPVLREELPGWLSDPALSQIVAAFAPAIASDGGRGAVYVLLA